MTLKTIDAGALRVAYEEHGAAEGWPCVLGHGFPAQMVDSEPKVPGYEVFPPGDARRT